MFCLVACLVLVLVALHLVQSGRTTLRAIYDRNGTELLPDRRFGVLVICGAVTAVPAFLALAIFVPRGGIDIPMSQGMQMLSPWLGWFGASIAVLGLITVWRGGIGYVGLTPDEIDIVNAAFTESVQWDDIADVTDSTETKKTRRAVVLCLRDGSEKIIDGADFYVPKGTALYWMVRHYWRHADDRAELCDGSALKRLREQRFETV